MFVVVFAWVVCACLGVVGWCGLAATVLVCLFACSRFGVGVVGVGVVGVGVVGVGVVGAGGAAG